jgi:ribosomal protection tetracycline resistance protein
LDIINLGILAHVDAGKTTVTENLLYKAGVIKQIGRVDSGNTVTDSLEIEKRRGITIRTATVSFDWKNIKVNLLDTPGHVDFIAEVERSVQILDGAILVISAKEGVQTQTRVIFNILKKMKIPTILFINKIDRQGVNLEKIYKSIKEKLECETMKMQSVIGEGTKDLLITPWELDNELKIENTETACLYDEKLLEKYLKKEKIEIKSTIIKEIEKNNLYPIYHGSALQGVGVEELLEGITTFLPKIKSNSEKPLSAVVYKIQREQNNQKNVYLRLFQGILKYREIVNLEEKNEELKIRNLETIKNGKIVKTNVVKAGDIAILPNVEGLKIGDFVGIKTEHFRKISMAFPTLKTTINPLKSEERQLLIQTLFNLSEEDPFLNCYINSLTNKIVINLFGEVQKEFIKTYIEERFNIKTELSDTITLLKEKPLNYGESSIAMWTKLNPYCASIGLSVEPTEEGVGFIYENNISHGFLTRPFQNAVLEGIKSALKQGLYGWELTDIKVSFNWAEYNSVDSTPADYRNLAPLVLMEALEKSGTKLMQPIMTYKLTIPSETVGKAISDLIKMKATLSNPLIKGEETIIEGKIPVETSKKYSLELASYTEGKGMFDLEFVGYEPYDGEIIIRERMGYDATNRVKYLLQKSNAIKI